jgi:hypothetical protein
VDLALELYDGGTGLPFVVVLEPKATDWDRLAMARIRPNVLRHARQVWTYLESLVERVAGELAFVQGALVYPRRPEGGRLRCWTRCSATVA